MSKLIEQMKVYIRVLLLNRRSTLLSFLGLGLSLVLISEGLIVAYTYQYGAFVEHVGETPSKQLTVSMSAFDIEDNSRELNDYFHEITAQISSELGLTTYIRKMDWYFEKFLILGIQVPAVNGNFQYLRDINLYGVSYDYFSVFQSLLFNGSLPSNSDDVLVVAKSSTFMNSNLSVGTFPLYIPTWGGVMRIGDINVSGIIKKEQFNTYDGSSQEDLKAMTEYFTEEFMLINIDNFPNGVMRPLGRYSFYIEDIDSFNIDEDIANINALSQQLTREFKEAGYTLHVYNHLNELLRDFADEFKLFQLFGILFLVPLAVVSIALASFSANLLKRRQRQQIASLFQRGSSQTAVWVLLFVQLVEVTVSGIIFCCAIGYPFTWLMLKSTDFLAFAKVGLVPVIKGIIFYVIIGAAFVISFVINLLDIKDLSKISLTEAHEEVQQKQPLWRKLYLDICLLIIGLIIWLIVKYHLQATAAYTFAYNLGIIAPACIILGGILLAARLYIIITEVISKELWKSEKLGIFAFSTKRSSRRKQTTLRSVLLIALTFTLLFTVLISVESYKKFDTEKAYYSVGADILVKNVNSFSNETKNQILAIPGVQEATYLYYTSQVVSYSNILYSYLIVGIDPQEFTKTAYFDKEYLNGKTPEDFFNTINKTTDVVMQYDQYAKAFNVSNVNITVPVEKYPEGMVTHDLQVVGLYKFLPRFFIEFPSIESTTFSFTIISKYALVDELAYSPINIAYDIIVKVTEEHSITQVAEKIENTLNMETENVEDVINRYSRSFRNTMLYSSLNTTFIFSIIIAVASILLLILIQLVENKREINILRIIGFSPKQFYKLFLTEVFQIMFFCSIIGLFLGILTSTMLMDILTFKTAIPSDELSFPFTQLFIVMFTIMAIALLTTVITVGIIFRKEAYKEKEKEIKSKSN